MKTVLGLMLVIMFTNIAIAKPLTEVVFEHEKCSWTEKKHYVMRKFSVKGFITNAAAEECKLSASPDKNLKMKFYDKNNSVLFTANKNNPFYKDENIHKAYQTLDCRFSLKVQLPAKISLNQISRVVFEAGDFEQDLVIDNNIFNKNPEIISEQSYEDLNKIPRKAYRVYGDSPPEKAWDLVFVTEGFTKDDFDINDKESVLNEDKLLGSGLKRLIKELFSHEPYSKHKDRINIWVVAAHSKNSILEPPIPLGDLNGDSHGENLNAMKKYRKERNAWLKKNKQIGREFDTLLKTSYGNRCGHLLTVKEGRLAFNLANTVPFDNLMVLINTDIFSGFGGAISHLAMSKNWGPDLIDETFIHELAHNLGHLADEYSYLGNEKFVDQSSCDNILINDVMSWKNHKGSMSGAGLFTDDELNAPNLTIYKDKQKAKWSKYLNEDSPVVDFIHPSKVDGFEDVIVANRFVSTKRVKFHFNSKRADSKIIFANERPLIFNSLSIVSSGRNGEKCEHLKAYNNEQNILKCKQKIKQYNQAIIASIIVNGKKIPEKDFSISSDYFYNKKSSFAPIRALNFIEINAPLLVGTNKIEFNLNPSITYDYYGEKRSALPNAGQFKEAFAFKSFLVNQKFSATEMGLFQGSGVSLTEGYRPTFLSGMREMDWPYNIVQIEALESALLKHIND